MFSRLCSFVRRPNGASSTEKLVVIVAGALLVLGAFVMFGDALFEVDAPRTIAERDAPPPEGTNPAYYVLFVFGATVFGLLFMIPTLFPRAHRRRKELITNLAEKFPFLLPLVDPDHRADENLGQLRELADEVGAVEREKAKRKEGALEIDVPDLGRLATPSEETVTQDAKIDAPYLGSGAASGPPPGALDEVLAEPDPEELEATLVRADPQPAADESDDSGGSDGSDDAIPFPDATSDILAAAASGTSDGDALDPTIHKVVDDAEIVGSEDETVIHRTGPTPAVDGGVDPDATTNVRDALEKVKKASDATTKIDEVGDDDPDAPTKTYDALKKRE